MNLHERSGRSVGITAKLFSLIFFKQQLDTQYRLFLSTAATCAENASNTSVKISVLLHDNRIIFSKNYWGKNAGLTLFCSPLLTVFNRPCTKWFLSFSLSQRGDISTLNGGPLKLRDKFIYQGRYVSSTEKDINVRLAKAWTAIDRLSVIWKSDLTDKIKLSFFPSSYTAWYCYMDALLYCSILLYGCTTRTLTSHMEKRLDGNYTTMLLAILNKSWRQHPTKQQLYGHLPPITKTIQDEPNMRDTAGKVKSNSWAIYSCGLLHVDEQRQDDQLEPIYNKSVSIYDIAVKTSWEPWTIETGGDRGQGDLCWQLDIRMKKCSEWQQILSRRFEWKLLWKPSFYQSQLNFSWEKTMPSGDSNYSRQYFWLKLIPC